MKLTLLLLFTLGPLISALADITLVRDGQPQAVIIVPEGLYKQVKQVQKPAKKLAGAGATVPLAAVELADYLGKMGGTRPQIATETQEGLLQGPPLDVGHCKARADLGPKPVKPGEARETLKQLIGFLLAPES